MSKTNSWSILFTVIITAIIAGGGVYLWQTSEGDSEAPQVSLYDACGQFVETRVLEDVSSSPENDTEVTIGDVLYLYSESYNGYVPEGTGCPDEAIKPQNTDLGALLYEREYYDLPFGAAEIEGYYTTVESPLGLGDDVPTETCAAFVVTDAPEMLISALEDERFGVPPTVVIGPVDSYWGNIYDSTEGSPIKVLATLNPTFEGEIIGCMSWPFESLIETGK